MGVITDDVFLHLYFLLEFLAAWEKRPACLTPMAYKWCSAFSSEVADLRPPSWFTPRFKPQGGDLDHRITEWLFSFVGPSYDPVCTGDTFKRNLEHLKMWATSYPEVLPVVLDVGFRLVMPGRNQQALELDHTPCHDLVFRRAFSSGDDEVVADGVCAWIADSDHTPDASCVHHLAKRMEKDTPFSPRLRQMGIRLIERVWRCELRVSALEVICLLNRLDVGVDDIEDRNSWARLLVGVICSPAGLEGLSICYWHLLEGLPKLWELPAARGMEVARLLEEAEDWEKLEVWIAILWKLFQQEDSESKKDSESEEDPKSEEDAKPMPDEEHLKQVTLKLLQRRPSAFPRFEDLSGLENSWRTPLLKDICATPICSDAVFALVNRFTLSESFLSLFWGTTLSKTIYYIHVVG